MKSIAIIPARHASKGLPDKNSLPVLGLPMVLRAVQACFGAVDRIVVSTDSPRVQELCGEFKPDAWPVTLMGRPAELAGDRIGVDEVARDVLRRLYPDGKMPEITVIVQPNLPIWEPGVITRILAMLHGDAKATAVGTAFKIDTFPQWFKRLDENGFARAVHQTMAITRQDFFIPLYFDGAAIAVRTEILMESERRDHYHLYWAGPNLLPHLRHPIYGMEVHDQQDLQVAECVLRGMER